MNCGVARTWPSGKSVTGGVDGVDGALGGTNGPQLNLSACVVEASDPGRLS